MVVSAGVSSATWPACVSYEPVASSATQRNGRPAAIIAASPCRLCGNESLPSGYGTGGVSFLPPNGWS